MKTVHQVKRLISTLALFVVLTTATHAQIPGVIDPKSDVKDLISDFRSEMSALISQAGGETRATLVQAYQLIDSLISSLSAVYGDNLKLTFKELDGQQQKAFYDTRQLIEDVRKQIAEPIKHATETADRATAVIADVASWSKKPMVTAYSPTYVSPASISDDVIVTIKGFRMQAVGFDAPKLVLGGKEYSPVTLTDVLMAFQIPRNVFDAPKTRTTFQSGTLSLYRDPGGWWPWRRPVEVTFKLLFTVMPELLGTYSVHTVVRTTVVHRQSYTSQDVSVTKEGGGGAAAPPGASCFSPDLGCKFDIATAVPKETSHLAHKDNDHSPGTNTGGVYLGNVKTPDTICLDIIANTNCTECGATTAGHLEVDEYQSQTNDVPSDTEVLPLNWKGPPPIIPQPDNLQSEVILMALFDEISLAGSPTSPPSTPFVSIENDFRNHTVYLRPKLVWKTPNDF